MMLRVYSSSISVLVVLALCVGALGTACTGDAEPDGSGGSGTGGVGGEGGADPTGGGPSGGAEGLGGLGGAGGEGGQGTGGGEPCEQDCPDAGPLHVSPNGDDAAEGTALAPVETMGEALARVAAAVAAGEEAPLVYVCATVGAYQETLSLTAEHGAVSIAGGFDCDDFEPSEVQAVFVAEEATGHRIEGATGVTLADVQLESPDASGDGASSVALTVVDSTGVRLLRSDLVAGEGAPGDDGMGYAERAEPGEPGNEGADACVATADEISFGGPAATTSCGGVVTASVGATGGAGGGGLLPVAGGNGGPGQPDGGPQGLGEDAELCTTGDPGEPGASGTHGTVSTEFGDIGADGYVPPMAGSGTQGGLGEGGGGGGGAAKPASCDTGASGGSGGGGGCPGMGAAGGQGGGGSFGLISVSSELQLVELSIVVAVGGEGGAGGDGQEGGVRGDGGGGGLGASGGNDACRGGDGGRGGNGGSGAGGAGGPSIGVAYVGDAPTGLGEVEVAVPSSPAMGGPGGVLHTISGQGPNGVVMDTWSP